MALKETYKKGFVELILLKLLSEGEYYGYELVQTVEERSGGVVEIPEGSLYPTLYKMAERGWIEGDKRPSGKRQMRIYYHLTEVGEARLAEMLQEFHNFQEGMRRVMYPEPSDD